MLSIIFWWIIPIYFYIGLFNLLYVVWIDGLQGMKLKEATTVVIGWPIMWFVILILKYGK